MNQLINRIRIQTERKIRNSLCNSNTKDGAFYIKKNVKPSVMGGTGPLYKLHKDKRIFRF